MKSIDAPGELAQEKASPGFPEMRTGTLLTLAGSICLAVVCLIIVRHLFQLAAPWPQGWFNSFDAGIMTHINHLSDRWLWLNPIVSVFTEHNLLTDGPLVLLLWIAFFPRTGSTQEISERRSKIAATVTLALFGVVLARILALVFPFRERPLRTVALHFQLPHFINPGVLYGWSSFPSDHTVLLITLSVGLLMVSRPLGIIALVYTFAVNLFLRMYLGFHWPTDILASVAIGVGLACITAIPYYRNFVWRLVMKCWHYSPGIFAAFVFILSYEIIDMFEGPLTLAKAVLKHHLQ